MAEYALINNGVVANVIVAEADFIAANFPGAVQVDQLTPRPGIGWSFDGTTWIAPAPPPPTNSVYLPTDFMKLFTDAELQTAFAFENSTTLTDTQKNQLREFFEFFHAAVTGIDMTMTPTINGLHMLEAYGLIGSGRAAQILASRHF